MTIDKLKVKAGAAKAWRPGFHLGPSRGESCKCGQCLGAQRAVEDIADRVTHALEWLFDKRMCWIEDSLRHAMDHVNFAARISSYFASEPNPVSEFRDAVRKFVEAGK